MIQPYISRHVGMADDADSKSVVGNHVWVQVPLPAVNLRSQNALLISVLASFLLLSLCICVSNWLRMPPLTEPEENAVYTSPTVRMMGTVVRFMHRRIQHCSAFLRTRQWRAPSVWLG